jgi:hypothetical protein
MRLGVKGVAGGDDLGGVPDRLALWLPASATRSFTDAEVSK